jgi:alpha-L-fucosidase 2
MQMLRHLFAGCIEAAQVLGVDEALRAELAAARARLVPTRVAPDDGRLMEWFEDYRDVDPQHRHIMPLWGAYPGTEITVQATPALVEAAKRTLAVREAGDLPGRGNNGPGWGLVMRVGFWARFRDAAQCARLLKLVLRPVAPGVTSQRETAGAYPNLFLACPPFQIDANLASPAVIAEMLLQSHTGEIELLPTLPEEWRQGSFERLCARGGFQVSAAWSAGKLTSAVIRRTAAGPPCRIRYRDRSVELPVAPGGEVTIDGALAVVSR